MASPNFAKKNPFMGMTVAQMKKYYDKKVRGKGLKAKDLKVLADQMQAAKKAAPKPKAATSKTSTKSTTTTKSSTGSGVTGQYRKKGDPGPAVVKEGSRTGASVDPRERQLRKNRQEAKRGSTTAGRANIKAQVDAVSGSSKRNQRQVEERRRRARRRAMLKNRRQLLSRRHNDM